MKRTFFLIFPFLFNFLSVSAHETVAPYLPAQEKQANVHNAPITVQYPYEKMRLARGTKEIFIFGQINLPQPITLDINGHAVEVYKNGAFVTFLPVENGDFPFVLTATSAGQTVRAVRHVKISGTPLKDFTHEAAFDKEEVFPARKVEVLPGDSINLYVRGTPHAKVHAKLPNLKNAKNIPLKEDATHPGIYRTTFTVDAKQPEKSTKVVYYMKDGPEHTKAKITAPAKIYVRDSQEPFTYAQVTQPGVKVRKLPTASGNLYPDYRAYGVVRVTGERAGQYRLRLSERETAWLEKKHLKGTRNPEAEPNVLSFIRTDTTDTHTRLEFTLSRAVPIKIREYKDRLELTLYYVDQFEQSFSLDDTSPLLENIQWSEPAERAVSFRLQLRKNAQLWGYAYDFEGSKLTVDLVHPPLLHPTADKPLNGARIVIDAGHSPHRTVPYDGAVGPTGYLEYEATLALASDLKPKLQAAGATVIMTREGTNHMTLQQRYQKAIDEGAHLFISLHYNALPATINPLERPRGFSVYYNYPHSFSLAEKMHQSFVKNVPLPDEGMIANDVLFIPRISQFPSILVENAYLILPEQEQLAKTPQGRELFIKALYEGILNFYKGTEKSTPRSQK